MLWKLNPDVTLSPVARANPDTMDFSHPYSHTPNAFYHPVCNPAFTFERMLKNQTLDHLEDVLEIDSDGNPVTFLNMKHVLWDADLVDFSVGSGKITMIKGDTAASHMNTGLN